ncbi:energy transducer TonB [Pseudoteredinibacter isoporae]|uniref:Outer membrane biosynthesis protein TonB n=1 Tax=Pseudoteredinibacter isoporae TaxID=570281 RepID=A0A7X0MVU8_9GAMM|nr:energy transducer TonB [Pseudoteredinibacter isoporae]MBB6521778.1 outer membrane biosynthesis protein TonB [Pseudoteredinibacter isoporae]NHO87325.1 hypothetical protein [Pseudoteredinibacter isoporae]NIB23043.1 hypothetical protein [Pseudoteredinibacter isoporae]
MKYIFLAFLVFWLAACSAIPERDITKFKQVTLSDMGLKAKDLVKIAPKPRYPRGALKAGLEGHCKVVFDIDTSGMTYNLNIVSCSHRVFEASSLMCVKDMVFEKPVFDGESVIVKNAEWKLSYSIEG